MSTQGNTTETTATCTICDNARHADIAARAAMQTVAARYQFMSDANPMDADVIKWHKTADAFHKAEGAKFTASHYASHDWTWA
jgi:hypothetical protein